MPERPPRSAMPLAETWDLEQLYPDEAAWEADLARIEQKLPELAAFQGRLGESAGVLLSCLQQRDALVRRLRSAYFYGHNRLAEDQSDPERQGLAARAMAAFAEAGAVLAFLQPEILALPAGAVEGYLATEPGLQIYRLELTDLLAEREHQLGAEAEAVLAQLAELSEAPYLTFQAATAADARFEPVNDEQGQEVAMSPAAAGVLLQSADRSVREAAYWSQRRAYLAHKRTLAVTFATAQKRDVLLARLRHYPSALAAALAADHLPVSLYHNLLQASEAGSHELRRHLDYRRQALGLDRLQPWDLQAPLDAGVTPQLSFVAAQELIIAALAPLGPAYAGVLEQAFAERWIDRADNAGKHAGAYTAPHYDFHPVVLMTWKDRLSDAFTLAHELGHAVHYALTGRSQPFAYYDISAFLAEMASTTNELLLARHLLATTQDRGVRRFVLARALDSFNSNFWSGSSGAAVMLRVHEMAEQGVPLTYESVTQANVETLSRWYGDSLEVATEGLGSAWLAVPHHYMNFYYYQYATGITGAAAFADAIAGEGAPAVQRYLGFLHAGLSAHPLAILQAAGVDMASPAPIQRAIAVYAQLQAELERT